MSWEKKKQHEYIGGYFIFTKIFVYNFEHEYNHSWLNTLWTTKIGMTLGFPQTYSFGRYTRMHEMVNIGQGGRVLLAVECRMQEIYLTLFDHQN